MLIFLIKFTTAACVKLGDLLVQIGPVRALFDERSQDADRRIGLAQFVEQRGTQAMGFDVPRVGAERALHR